MSRDSLHLIMALRVLDTAKLSLVFVVLVVFFYWSWRQNTEEDPEIQHQRQLISTGANKPTASSGCKTESNLTYLIHHFIIINQQLHTFNGWYRTTDSTALIGCFPPLWTLVEHLLQKAIMLSSSKNVERKRKITSIAVMTCLFGRSQS